MLEDTAGRLWFGTMDTDLIGFNPKSGEFDRYQQTPGDPNSLAGNGVIHILEDHSGNLWIGTYTGISKLRRGQGAFDHFKNEPGRSDTLTSRSVFSIVEDNAGQLRVSTAEGGIDRLDPHSGAVVHHTLPPPPGLPDIVSHSRQSVVDRQGRVWMATYGQGLTRFDPAAAVFTAFRHDPKSPRSLEDNVVCAMLVDSIGTPWAGTRSGTLHRFDPETEDFTRFQHPIDAKGSRATDLNPPLVLQEDPQGNIWIGTERGMFRFDPHTGKFESRAHDRCESEGATAQSIIAIHCDRQGVLWLGT